MNILKRIQKLLIKEEAKKKILCTFVPLKGKPYKRLCTVHKDYIVYKGNTYFLILGHAPTYKENSPIPNDS